MRSHISYNLKKQGEKILLVFSSWKKNQTASPEEAADIQSEHVSECCLHTSNWISLTNQRERGVVDDNIHQQV